jgi:tetratricopeptide (TPR) repeat protein
MIEKVLSFFLLVALINDSACGKETDFVAAANDAFDRKEYIESAQLFNQAARANISPRSNYYNAACAFSQAGRTEDAIENLMLSIDAGFSDSNQLLADPDLKLVRLDRRWNSVLTRLFEKVPSAKLLHIVTDNRVPLEEKYFSALTMIGNGMKLPERNQSPLLDHLANISNFIGEYSQARGFYARPTTALEEKIKSYTKLTPASQLILSSTKQNRAVFFNESHGNIESRLALYSMLQDLRNQGYSMIAFEALSTTAIGDSTSTVCTAPDLVDKDLLDRGYPISKSGYYTREPIFGNIIRKAISLGFRVSGYDSYVPGQSVSQREQRQAENLSCLFESLASNEKLVVLAGFDHIVEKPDYWVPGGTMASRFSKLSGIDPVTVDTAELSALGYDSELVRTSHGISDGEAYFVTTPSGQRYMTDKTDFSVIVPRRLERASGSAAGWLALGGARAPIFFSPDSCRDRFPCVLAATSSDAESDATPIDRCVVWNSSDRGCVIYSDPSRKDVHVSALASDGSIIGLAFTLPMPLSIE